MIAHPTKSILAVALLAVAGCATVPERDLVLEDARVVVYAARTNPQVVSYAPVELDQAVATLAEADGLALRGDSLNEVHRLALVANQRAALAQNVARTRSAEAALAVQLAARDAQLQADLSRRQADAAQLQAAAAQRQAEDAQRQAAAIQLRAQAPDLSAGVLQEQLSDLAALPTSRGLVVTLNDTMFDPGSSELQPGALYTVQKLAVFLTAHPERTVAIEGFTDTSGNGYFDQKLSERRALAVQAALVSLGVDSRRTIVRGYGRAYPIASNATAAGRQMNRRVEIVVSDRGGVVTPRG
jgi:outer membrane protein OmpA-like peptidoglycan-associated protein